MTTHTCLILTLVEGQTTTLTSAAQTLTRGSSGIGRLVYTNNSGTNPTLAAKIQHSPDGTIWKDLLTFTGVTTGSGVEDVHVTPTTLGGTVIYPQLRAVSTLGGTNPNYDIDVRFYAAN